MSDPVVARIKISFPEKLWLASVLSQFPGVASEIQSFLPGLGAGGDQPVGNALIKLTGTNVAAALEKIREHPSLVALNVLVQDPTTALVNAKTRDRFLLGALVRAEVVLRFPVVVKWDGSKVAGTWVVTGLRSQVDHLLDLFEERGVGFEILSLERLNTNAVAGTLTPRQAEILEIALEEGYFDSPRRISLTDLAKKVGVAKSTLSGILRRISKKKMVL